MTFTRESLRVSGPAAPSGAGSRENRDGGAHHNDPRENRQPPPSTLRQVPLIEHALVGSRSPCRPPPVPARPQPRSWRRCAASSRTEASSRSRRRRSGSRPATRRTCTPSRRNCGSPTAEARRLYLHTSPEFACKKLLAAGERRIVSIGRVWRNRERGALHHPGVHDARVVPGGGAVRGGDGRLRRAAAARGGGGRDGEARASAARRAIPSPSRSG